MIDEKNENASETRSKLVDLLCVENIIVCGNHYD